MALSWDHKPSIPSEKERIIAAGHRVQMDRVDGGLAMSRALGDWQYKSGKLPVKDMAVSSFPDVKTYQIEKDTKYLVLACDGIWDVMDNQLVLDFIEHGKLLQTAKAENKEAEFDYKKFHEKAGVRWREPEEIRELMVDTMESSEYCGLSTLTEMMFEINCAPSV